MFKTISKKKAIGLLCSVIALVVVVGSWAYYSSTNTLDNQMKTKYYGDALVEQFTPKYDWQPGQTVDKQFAVHNTGEYDLFVRVSMSETWTIQGLSGPTSITFDSNMFEFYPQTKETSHPGGGSVVYKGMAPYATVPKSPLNPGGWTFDRVFGYWYYNEPLKPGESTPPLLYSITLCSDADMGKFDEIRYYTKAPNMPASDNIGSDDTTQWVAFTGVMPNGTTYSRSVTMPDAAHQGYSNASYVLNIKSETVQATREALEGTTWRCDIEVPNRVWFLWGLNNIFEETNDFGEWPWP